MVNTMKQLLLKAAHQVHTVAMLDPCKLTVAGAHYHPGFEKQRRLTV